MGYSKHFAGAIWTNHALERLGQRGLSQVIAAEAFRNPDRYFSGKQEGTVEYQRRFGNSTVTIIAKENDQHQWIILSCWIDPPLPGTLDAKKKEAYHKYLRSSGWGKMWILFKKQLYFLITGKNSKL